ncbi:MAG: hypothetical protein KAJ14_13345, partial [Candidatus Omnitrophica bacterium]|nr:hypothetical protein [Candidatus Omnitrophota bacterium]
NGTPLTPAGTAAVIGDLKQMNVKWLKGASFLGYGSTLSVGIGVPIPILNEEMAQFTAVSDEDISASIVDYSKAYPEGISESVGRATYAELKLGKITINGKQVTTAGISSYYKAKEIAEELKSWIKKGDFLLTEAVAQFPGADSDYKLKPMKIRELKGGE